MDTVSQSRNDDVSLSALVPDVEVFEGQEEEASVSVQNQPERRDLFQLETDDPTPCAVCGVVDPEPQNEMIFCDVCGLCVHQGCYGVGHIPPGGWKCSPCSVGQNPSEIRCYFCPGYGGALSKMTINHIIIRFISFEYLFRNVMNALVIHFPSRACKISWPMSLGTHELCSVDTRS